ncbi:MAG: hypothetical protein SFX18_15795 [Pirellulales bacterium]|nr:hypothetical protein [Pirellulales bacterium]
MSQYATAFLDEELGTGFTAVDEPEFHAHGSPPPPPLGELGGLGGDPWQGGALLPVQTALDAWRGTQTEIEVGLTELFTELEQYRERFYNEELKLREERLQLAELKTQLAYERADWEAEQQESGSDLQHKLRDLERERSELEIELESIRNRAAELTDQLTEQKRHLAKERESWTNEFRQLRQTLEKQSQLLAQRTSAAETALRGGGGQHSPTAAPASPAPRRQETPASDPVVGTVKSQFQLLQNDIARRRAQLKKNE